MNLGMGDMLFIFVLALLIFGPRRLPQIAREVGKFMAEFKRAGNEFKHQIEAEVQNLELEEQIKKDAEKREAAMRDAEQKRRDAASQGELFDVPNPPAMPTILPPEITVVNEPATPKTSLLEAPPEAQGKPNV